MQKKKYKRKAAEKCFDVEISRGVRTRADEDAIYGMSYFSIIISRQPIIWNSMHVLFCNVRIR